MQQKNSKLSAVLLLGIGLSGLYAQEVILSSGGNSMSNNGSVSYSIGQLVYTSNIGITGIVTQGVQQPYEISVVTGIEITGSITLQFSVYPNPASDFLTLKVENYTTKGLSYQLYNINGELLEGKEVENLETSVGMSHLVPAIYFMKVFQNEQEIETFKIIKN